MYRKRIVYLLLASFIVLNCFSGIASATTMEVNDVQYITFNMERATGRFSLDVPANSTILANTDFPLEAGESVSINATYSPRSASVEFGLVAPDGLFYGIEGEDGNIDISIQVEEHGYYTMGIKNNSNVEVAVSGIVNY